MSQLRGAGRWARRGPGVIVIDLGPPVMGEVGEVENFLGSFRIRQRLPESRKFPVSSGTVTVRSTARWDRPSPCNRMTTYSMTLWREVDWWFDSNQGTQSFPVPGTATRTWSGLPSGTYYLEIFVGNTDPDCILIGEMEVT